MNKYFLLGIATYLISILLISIRFDIPYQLNFNSLVNKINLEGFDVRPVFLMTLIIVFISFILSFIPFKSLLYLNKFTILFFILNILFLGLAIYIFVDNTIIYSNISCEYKQIDF